ncbi:unnamed protein product [Ambrosiozyma monospora]|uniref:Unnamed protein product n=1 Tax=Ambrosiozyma monospora TaxID=43982 RepID=A0A9W6Z8F5_AMBMO|nr:unnamed protein product [Ambrosiozyma monospora]
MKRKKLLDQDNESQILSELHSQVKPIEIGDSINQTNDINIGSDSNNNSVVMKQKKDSLFHEEMFKLAGSPEREGDKFYLSNLPSNYTSLSFTDRKKSLNSILPVHLQNDVDYKSHLNKLIRKSSYSRSSTNIMNGGGSSQNASLKGYFGGAGSTRGSSAALRYLGSFSVSSVTSSMQPPENSNVYGSVIFNKWKLEKITGSGAFGVVRSCVDIGSDTNSNSSSNSDLKKAIKIIKIDNDPEFEKRFKCEILMWSFLQHGNILQMEDFYITSDYIFVVMPFVKGGSLLDLVQAWESYKVSFKARFNKVKSFLLGIAKGLSYMHDLGMFHGDVKLENCLVDIENGDRPLLCDFGMANFFNESRRQDVPLTAMAKKLLSFETHLVQNYDV